MSKKPNSKKIKIIQFKDIVSLAVLAVMIFCTVTYSFGAVINNGIRNRLVTTLLDSGGGGGYSGDLSANQLFQFTNITNIVSDGEGYDTNLNKLTFNSKDLPITKDLTDKYNYTTQSILQSRGWKLANYTKVSTVIGGDGKTPMTACTFIKQNDKNIDLVIAYKSSEGNLSEALENTLKMIKEVLWEAQIWKNQEALNDLLKGDIIKVLENYCPNYKDYFNGNWEQDIISIIVGYTGVESEAMNYATKVAEHYFEPDIREGKNINIYITGHSLGGYQAQFGGAALLDNSTYKNSVKEIGYFNGMGIRINNLFVKSGLVLGETRKKVVEKAYDILADTKNIKNIMTSYQTRGDWCSAVGEHVGSIKEYYSNSEVIKENRTESSIRLYKNIQKNLTFLNDNDITKIILKIFMNVIGMGNSASGKNIYKYVDMYNVPNLEKYLWTVHHQDAFNGWDLDSENRIVEISKIKFTSSLPNIMKKNEKTIMDLSITLKNAELGGNLNKNNFKTAAGLTITKIETKRTSVSKKINYDKTYTITYQIRITMKANKNLIPFIVLKEDCLMIKTNPNGFSELILNNDRLIKNSRIIEIINECAELGMNYSKTILKLYKEIGQATIKQVLSLIKSYF